MLLTVISGSECGLFLLGAAVSTIVLVNTNTCKLCYMHSTHVYLALRCGCGLGRSIKCGLNNNNKRRYLLRLGDLAVDAFVLQGCPWVWNAVLWTVVAWLWYRVPLCITFGCSASIASSDNFLCYLYTCRPRYISPNHFFLLNLNQCLIQFRPQCVQGRNRTKCILQYICIAMV